VGDVLELDGRGKRKSFTAGDPRAAYKVEPSQQKDVGSEKLLLAYLHDVSMDTIAEASIVGASVGDPSDRNGIFVCLMTKPFVVDP
tara:strand:- start:170 stop:427 length:258 start_codon:yes stop_codon:yes gene_type:complete